MQSTDRHIMNLQFPSIFSIRFLYAITVLNIVVSSQVRITLSVLSSFNPCVFIALVLFYFNQVSNRVQFQHVSCCLHSCWELLRDRINIHARFVARLVCYLSSWMNYSPRELLISEESSRQRFHATASVCFAFDPPFCTLDITLPPCAGPHLQHHLFEALLDVVFSPSTPPWERNRYNPSCYALLSASTDSPLYVHNCLNIRVWNVGLKLLPSSIVSENMPIAKNSAPHWWQKKSVRF